MDTKASQAGALQLVGGKRFRPGSEEVRRVKPKHLRRTLQNVAALEFQRLESPEDAADALDVIGVTAKVVSDCATLNLLRRMEKIETFLSLGRGMAA
jgi:hypothetical protein